MEKSRNQNGSRLPLYPLRPPPNPISRNQLGVHLLLTKTKVKLYSGFTHEQYNTIINYMKENSGLGIVPSADANLSSNYIYSVDQILPAKSDVLDYLKNDKIEAPAVKAKVTLFMGASSPKAIKEVVVYPVDAPNKMEDFANLGNKVPTWQSRPVCNLVETKAIDDYLREILKPLKSMLKAHWNLWYDESCDTATCLFYGSVPRIIPRQTDRVIFIFFHYPPVQEDYYLWPVSIELLIYTPSNGDRFALKTVIYDNVKYGTIAELEEAYNTGKVRNIKPGANQQYGNSFGSPRRRGPDMNPDDLSPPTLTSEAKRFSVSGSHVSWLGWEFDFAFQTISASQMFNLHYNGESIAYQLGLQDIMVVYTGENLNRGFRSYMDVGWSIGSRTSALLKGYDCPSSAEYITAMVYEVGFDRPIMLKNAACVFEYRNHVPLRRHYSTDFLNYGNFRFNMNMPDVVLVFRQILTIWNYDYILDVELHQSGVIKTSVAPTGYIQVNAPLAAAGVRYGYNLLPKPGIVGLLHGHFFDFKIDLDIADGSSNRFMTIDLEPESIPHPYNPEVNISYIVAKESLKSTEQEAIIHYDFLKPKQYIVYSQNETNERNGYSRGYRIQSDSFVNPVLPASDPLLTVSSWMNHQIAVTKFKDQEKTTLSYFSQGDPYDPLVSLSNFQQDDESIIDTDLVCWVSIGVNHLPTAEDIPVTTTASKAMSFHLIPHNYFLEDPSIGSRDAKLLKPEK